MVVQQLSYINMQKKRGLETYICLSGLGNRSETNCGQATNQAQLDMLCIVETSLLSRLLFTTYCIQMQHRLNKLWGAFCNTLYVGENLMTSAIPSFCINHEHDWVLGYSQSWKRDGRADLIDTTATPERTPEYFQPTSRLTQLWLETLSCIAQYPWLSDWWSGSMLHELIVRIPKSFTAWGCIQPRHPSSENQPIGAFCWNCWT